MYFGFGTASASGFWALLYLNRNLRGNFQQRFRANSMVGLLILNAAFLLYALPADPVWHWIFGEDITAWSIPHLILLSSFVLTQLLALDLHVSTWRRHEWRVIFALRLRDSLSLVILAANPAALASVDAYRLGRGAGGRLLPLVGALSAQSGCWRRISWLASPSPASSRRDCCAALASGPQRRALLALVIRIGLIQLFEAEMLQFVAWIAALLPLLAIDLWAYYCSASRGREPEWRGTAAAVIAAMAINALVIRHFYNLPDADNLAYAAAIVVTGLGMSWLINKLTDAMLRQREAAVNATTESQRIKPAASFGLSAAFLVFILLFIATAAPPV